MGTVVGAGLLAATLFGIFFIPALFVFVERLAGRRESGAAGRAPPTDRAAALGKAS